MYSALYLRVMVGYQLFDPASQFVDGQGGGFFLGHRFQGMAGDVYQAGVDVVALTINGQEFDSRLIG